ncbi:MAG: MXAN_6521/LA_1396 family lipoprotein [Leptospiraceae bacterium]|nr:MXAN_6521/LA_1396 family lipoprotein [Leptospiraceae bacterium]
MNTALRNENRHHNQTARATAPDRRLLRASASALLLITLLSGCTVKYTYLKPGYEQNDLDRVKRLVLTIQPNPSGTDAADDLILGVAREFISHHREFIIYTTRVESPDADWQALCASADARPDAVLRQKVARIDHTSNSETTELEIHATMQDCRNGDLLWEARAANSYDSNDADLRTTIESYTRRYGEEARPYVSAAYLLLRQLFDELPEPALNDEEILEKIEADANVSWKRLLYAFF